MTRPSIVTENETKIVISVERPASIAERIANATTVLERLLNKIDERWPVSKKVH
jgi:hypothetical protein